MNFEKIKLIVLDVDGTMTDGGIYIDNNRVEFKKFCIKDGAGILIAQKMNIKFMILTGRKSNCVEQRANELNMEYIFQNVNNKASYLKQFMLKNSIHKEEVAYIGDDLNDLLAMKFAGCCVCPADAVDEVKRSCDMVLTRKGGEGAVREFVELLLKNRKQWEEATKKFLAEE